jgi:hypothetical protein
MAHDLLIGLFALSAGVGLIVIGRPNGDGESPRFVRSRSLQMFYPSIVLVFFAVGIAELISWFVTKG